MEIMYLRLLGQAYGRDSYGENLYSQTESTDGGSTQEQTVQQAPAAPDTGLMQHQPVATIAVLVLVAVVLYVATLMVLKKVRSSKR